MFWKLVAKQMNIEHLSRHNFNDSGSNAQRLSGHSLGGRDRHAFLL